MNSLKHLAIVMDGNGRWAKQNKLPRSAGHYKGVEVLRNITIYANKLGIKCLTVYAFSTENWKRSLDEVNYIMSLPKIFFSKYIQELMDNNVRIMIIGDRDKVPKETMNVIDEAIEETKNNSGLILNFAFNYGGRDEIVNATKRIIKDGIDPSNLDEDTFAKYLYNNKNTDVDLLIRTGGDIRISNFLLWQIAYSEFYFCETLWPDFNKAELYKALYSFQHKERRFGGLVK